MTQQGNKERNTKSESTMEYVHIYCSADGESHFEESSVEVFPVEFAPPAPPFNVSAPFEAEGAALCEFPAGWFGDWHPSPRRQFYIQLSGALEVRVSDGGVRRLSAGNLVLLDDTSGKGHTTRVLGTTAVSGVFVYLASQPERG